VRCTATPRSAKCRSPRNSSSKTQLGIFLVLRSRAPWRDEARR
jgi:hypothetical protein